MTYHKYASSHLMNSHVGFMSPSSQTMSSSISFEYIYTCDAYIHVIYVCLWCHTCYTCHVCTDRQPMLLAGLPQHSSQVLPRALDIFTLRPVTDLSSSSWQTSLRKSWNGDFLVLAPRQLDGDDSMDAGVSSAPAASSHGFARLAALLRWVLVLVCCLSNLRLEQKLSGCFGAVNVSAKPQGLQHDTCAKCSVVTDLRF